MSTMRTIRKCLAWGVATLPCWGTFVVLGIRYGWDAVGGLLVAAIGVMVIFLGAFVVCGWLFGKLWPD